MIERIVLINFMAHEHSVIELGPGLNVLTGPNNTGKSAVVEALRCVTQNSVPRQHIRHGAKEARVEVHLDDGWKVVWVRKKSHPLYEVWPPGADEPEVHAKFGRKVPEDVQRLLRMPQVVMDEGAQGSEIDLHLGNQRQPVFLLDRPGSVFAQFFAASTESTHLLSMQDLLKDKTREAKRTLKEAANRQRQHEQGLERLAPLPELELRSQAAEALLERVRQAQEQEPRLARLLEALRGVRERRVRQARLQAVCAAARPPEALQPVAALARLLERQAGQRRDKRRAGRRLQVLAPLASPPALADAATLARLLARLQALAERRKAQQARRLGLQPLNAPRELFPAPQLAQRLAALREAHVALRAATVQRRALAPLAPAPQLAEVSELHGLLARQAALRSRLQTLRQATERARQLTAPPDLEDVTALARRARQLRELGRQRDTLARGVAARDAELEAFRQKLDRRLRELGACPLCGAALETESFLQKGHVHGSPDHE